MREKEVDYDKPKMTHPDLDFWRTRVRMWQGEVRGGKDDQDESV
jgi:hypothetical protein